MSELDLRWSPLGIQEHPHYNGWIFIPVSLRRSARWYRPESADVPDKGIASVEFYNRYNTIVFRDPRSAPASVAPDIIKQNKFSANANSNPLPIDIVRKLPLDTKACALIRAGNMPERLFAVPFDSLSEAVAPVAPQLAGTFRIAKEQDFSRKVCTAIGQVMTHEIFFTAFPHVLPRPVPLK